MNWPQLNKDYPLAYKLMVSSFKCLFTVKYYTDVDSNIVNSDAIDKANNIVNKVTIKHPLKRDLYDFFDGIGLVISINNQLNGAVIHDYFDWDIRTGLDVVHNVSLPETRSLTETEVFTKAFEMLNKTLKEECSK